MRRVSLALTLGFAAAQAGCAEELGPVERPSARVTGRVLLDGRPVGGGWVEFIPVDGTPGDLRSAPLEVDGTFEAAGVAAGRVAVRLVNPPVPLPRFPADPRVGFDQFTTPIRRTILNGDALMIDLRDEWRDFQARRGGR